MVSRVKMWLGSNTHYYCNRRRLINEAKIPMQELDGQRGEGLTFEGGLFSGGYGNSIILLSSKKNNTDHHLLLSHRLD